MWLPTWLRSGKQLSPPRKRPAFRPALEALEDRCVPSTLKVTNLGDGGKGSLRYEIAAAHSGDTIVFDKKLDGGTITLLSDHELSIGKNLTIQGPGAGLLTIASGADVIKTRIFEIDSATVALSGLTISIGGGRADAFSGDFYDGQGGGILNFGTLTISGCTVTGNSAENGGGIYNNGTLTVNNNSILSDNGLPGIGFGGGIYNAGTLTVSNSTVSGNFAFSGGGIYNTGGATVSGCILSGNNAWGGGDGGGIANEGTLTVSNSTVSGNFANSGGGIYNAGTLTVSNSTFSSNTPDNIFGPYTDGGGNTFK
jgi:hypothetical protein